MKDIHNIATKAKQQKREDNGTISKKDPARVKSLADEDGVLMGFFMQDSEMLSAFQ